ncbi:MAG: hypothetical protein WCK29_02485, partial [archaeon]
MKIFIFTIFFTVIFLFGNIIYGEVSNINNQIINIPKEENVLYTGKIYHIFFHSLIVYPKLAFDGSESSAGYK